MIPLDSVSPSLFTICPSSLMSKDPGDRALDSQAGANSPTSPFLGGLICSFKKKKCCLFSFGFAGIQLIFPSGQTLKNSNGWKGLVFFPSEKKNNNNPAITYTALIYVPSGFGQGRADSNTFFKYYILKANKLTGKMVAKNEGVFSESSCISPLLPWDPGAGWCDEISLDWGMWTIPRLLLTSFAP